LKLKAGPVIDGTFLWLEHAVPPMTYANGRVTSDVSGPLRLQHPTLRDVAVMIDTNRTDPVTPQQMEQAKVVAYLTATAFYLRDRDELRVFDLSHTPAGSRPVRIDAGFFRNAGIVMDRTLYPLALVAIFVLFLAWKALASGGYSLLALLLNSISGGSLRYPALLNIAVYAQTLVVLLLALSLYLPFAIPGFNALCLLITSVYIWLAVRPPQPLSPPASA
ncbi:MAG: DUF1189 family protein, partial [Elusimicrobia bacterium]|nr:DUF1189 family protein [Elusimicrobiota bacterium]